MPAAVETAAYYKLPAWHREGIVFQEAATSKEMLKLSGTDWEVRKLRPTAGVDEAGNTFYLKADNYRNVVRVTDGRILGQVTDTYNLHQNWEMFEFLDSLLKDGILHYESAGSLWDGKHVWALARLHDDWEILGEKFQSFLLIDTGHDGMTGIRIQPTIVRVVCANTLQSAHSRATKGKYVSISHGNGMQTKLIAAQSTFNITTSANRRTVELMQRAAEVRIDEDLLNEMAIVLFGDPTKFSTRKSNQVDKYHQIMREEVSRNGMLAYSAINGVTGYADHASNARTPDRQFTNVFSSGGFDLKTKAIEFLAKETGLVFA